MNGFILLTACLDNRAFFTEGVWMDKVEHLVSGIYASVLETSPTHELHSTVCQHKSEMDISCVWNASYSSKDCVHLRQANLDANTLFLDHQDAVELPVFCDIKLGCRH